MRKFVIAGNWKMNLNVAQSVELAKEIAAGYPVADANVDVVVTPTNLATAAVVEAVKGSGVKVAVQDVHWEDQGAFTGKISVDMVSDLGVEYVILGHSEQRQFFGETDETVNKKTLKVISAGLIPMVCIGETLAEREGGNLEAVLSTQIKGAYASISAEDALKTVVAYEPVWAIGTGVTASDEQAQDTQAFVRSVLAELYGAEVSEKISIQYGGSMKPGNATGLLGQKDIDGGLIGGASLKAEMFLAIIGSAKNL
ncbi:triose-phosphate isomerase [Fibrobacterales bacterium]|nr:triose-phosphate isomerase [Fibrobacterales bacterium]